MPSPSCQVKDGAGAYGATTNGVDVTPGNTVTINLVSAAGVNTWSIACITTDDLSSASTINAALTIDSVAKTATFTAPVAGRAYRFQSTVNSGIGPDGVYTPSYTTTFCIYTKALNGYRVGALDETFESNATYGWAAAINALIRGTQGTRFNVYSIPGEVQTSSTSQTVLGNAYFTMADETLCKFDFVATCARQTNVTKGGSYKASVTYRRTGGAAPTIVGALEASTDQETTAGDGVTFTVSGNVVRVSVTAADTDPRNWGCELRVQEQKATT